MDFFQSIQDEILVITSNSNKNKLLLQMNYLHSVKFMTKSEFLKKYLFDYDKECIYYIMKNYHVNYDISKIYLKNLYYINNDSDDKKIHFLYELKQELINHNLITFSPLFIEKVKHIDIVIYDEFLTPFETRIFKELNAKIIEEKEELKNREVYEFDSIDKEVEFVCVNIINLLKKGIDINRIKLLNVTDEYRNYIERIFKFYHIPINLPSDKNLYGNGEVIRFIKILESTKDIESSLNQIDNLDIYRLVVNVLNNYNFKEIDDIIIDCIKEEIKITYEKVPLLKNAIEIIDFNYHIDDEYVFFMGFNDSVPKIYKDEDYLTDLEKQKLNVGTSIDMNQLEKRKIIHKLNSIKNLTLTYQLKTPYNNYFPSTLIEELNYFVKKNVELKEKYFYSNSYNQYLLAHELDCLNKYNEHSENLDILYSTYPNISYATFDNKYNLIDPKKIYEYVDNKLILSYSSIENYYECGFKYYLSNILKLNQYEETIFTEIGTIFHDILSRCFDESFDLDIVYDEMIHKKEHTNKEYVFFKKLKEELKFIINTIKKQNTYSHLDNELYEQKIFINKDKNIKITFMGIVDKIKYTNKDGQTLLAVIDYKTGFPETDLTKTIYGLKMQLPIYLYLIKNSNLFDQVKIVGLYLQKIINSDIPYSLDKEYIKEKENQLKLDGYSIDDENILSEFDITYKDSELIKSMKIGKNGFYSYSKTLSSRELDLLLKLTNQKIEEARDGIIEAKYDINPKRIGDFIGCTYCKYHSICYRKEEDIVDLKEYKDLSFLKES